MYLDYGKNQLLPCPEVNPHPLHKSDYLTPYFLVVLNYRLHIISWRFCVKFLWPDGAEIAREIANCGYDVDSWLER